MAAYGNKVLTEGASEEEGLEFLDQLLQATRGSGRERP